MQQIPHSFSKPLGSTVAIIVFVKKKSFSLLSYLPTHAIPYSLSFKQIPPSPLPIWWKKRLHEVEWPGEELQEEARREAES
jgi:hypothetical protein